MVLVNVCTCVCVNMRGGVTKIRVGLLMIPWVIPVRVSFLSGSRK